MKRLMAGLWLAVSLASGWVHASEAQVRKNMQARYPGIPVESVTRTPMPGIYEVFANGRLINPLQLLTQKPRDR